MPQSDAVSKALSSAKTELAHANTFPSMAAKAALTGGAKAAKPATAKPITQTPTIGQELGAKAANVKEYTDALPKMHEGGPVQADGAYGLKAGEHVLTQPQAKMARRHALMSIGMNRLSQPAAPGAAEPAAKPAKKTPGVSVKSEKKSDKKVKVK
jgi:hypothetical protein